MSVLLPTESDPFEVVMSKALEPDPIAVSAIGAMRRVKHLSPRPSMLPFLVWEYGLGELTPYVPNLYNLIDQGVRWQRLRGTVSAVAIGLAWIGYSATVEETWTGRSWWNSFQLRFDALPSNDYPDLERIEGITRLSVPMRSQLRRGVHRYDLEPLEGDHSRLDNSMLDFSSGIAVTEKGTIWSFGRCHEFAHVLTEAEGLAIGNWLAPVEGGGLLWVDLNIPWIDANFRWSDTPEAQRRMILAGWFKGRTLYVRLADAAGVIGYRRCRAVHPVQVAFDGPYQLGDDQFAPSPSGALLYAEALTQFDDASDRTCTELALFVGAAAAPGIKPGTDWLDPNQIVGGVPVAHQAVTIPLRSTVREQIKFILRF